MDEAKAKKILGKDVFREDGGLYSLGRYLNWNIDEKDVCLDGNFETDDLEAIVWWMKNKSFP